MIFRVAVTCLLFALGFSVPWHDKDVDCALPPSCTRTIAPGLDTIRNAIQAAAEGDTICLQRGIYTQSEDIVVDKRIELRGPQAGADPRPTAGSARSPTNNIGIEAVIDGGGRGSIMEIAANNVVLDGLLFQNTGGGAGADMIFSATNSNIENLAIRFSIVHDVRGDEGMQIRDCANCVIEYNHVFDIRQDAINMCCGSADGIIRFNEVHSSASDNAAIYIYDSDSMQVADNLVYDVTDNDGIKMGESMCRNDPSAPNGSILRNVVHDTAEDGITVYSTNTVVLYNTIYNSGSRNGALYIGCNDNMNILVERNEIRDNNAVGIAILEEGAAGTAPDATTISINNNCIFGNNDGLTNEDVGTLDATNNWWGAANGPFPFGSGDTITTPGVVDFQPFLTAPPTCGAPPLELLPYPYCQNCAEFPCGHFDGRRVCTGYRSLPLGLYPTWQRKTRCIKGETRVKRIFELDESASCGKCPK